MASLFDFLVEHLGPATPQLASWRDPSVDAHDPETALKSTLHREIGKWVSLNSRREPGSTRRDGCRFAIGELGVGDFAFPSVVPCFKPDSELAVRCVGVCVAAPCVPAERTGRRQ